MWFEYTYKRKFDILDKDIQNQFNIDTTNIKKQKNDIVDDLFDPYTLYTFRMNWKDYVEYISEVTMSNGNYKEDIIYFIEKWKEIPDIKERYIMQGGECKKCGESDFTIEWDKAICNNCWYEWKPDDFFWQD